MEIPPALIGVVSAIIGVPLVFRLVRRLKPLAIEKVSDKELERLAKQYSKWEYLAVIFLLIFTPLFGFFLWKLFCVISVWHFSSLDDAAYVLTPSKTVWALPAMFFAMILSAILMHYCMLVIMGAKRYAEFTHYGNQKAGFDTWQLLHYMAYCVVPVTLIFFILAFDSYVLVNRESVTLNRLIGWGETVYTFDKIQKIEKHEYFIAPNGSKVEKPYYQINFSDGKHLNFSRLLSDLTIEQQKEIVDYIYRRSEKITATANSTSKLSEPFNNQRDITTRELIAHAKRVIAQAAINNVAATKEVHNVFKAADRLVKEGKNQQASEYYQKGLQLSPWSLKEQLNYARLLSQLGEQQQSENLAKMVYQTTEHSRLRVESGELFRASEPVSVSMLPNTSFNQKVICLVRVGNIDDWVIQKIGRRLQETLGVQVYYSPTVIGLPQATRSFYQRWSENLKQDVSWDHPRVMLWLNELGITSRETSKVDQTLELLERITVLQGNDDPRSQFDDLKRQVKAQGQQWNAELLLDSMVEQFLPPENVISIGLTEADIYVDESNFVFGLADMGSNHAVVSVKRFSAAFTGERENQKRFFDRLHKQLLSSVGFALGVPRPNDPRSARSYPSGLADHDQKGTWLSPQCIEGFEEALSHKLPMHTYKETNEQMNL